MSDQTVDRDPLEVVAESFLARFRAGERPSVEEYAALHPELADQIREHLPALVMVDEDVSINGGSGPHGEQPLTEWSDVLATLARSIGSNPGAVLPDTERNLTEAARTNPASDAMPAPGQPSGRYQLFGEIARGGMGAVLLGRDPDLGRDLAIKVLLGSHENKPEMVRRFVEEAQIGGQLQHPGIVPVYELGAFADRRPYFTMKLVKGRTLAALLSERAKDEGEGINKTEDERLKNKGETKNESTQGTVSPPIPHPSSFSADLPRFLPIFEAICQTVAYSHSRGVIHRDLKPSNIMVGAFGEVQVMDWGLAKVLKEAGAADLSETQPAAVAGTVATVRSGSDADESRAGTVLGTPAYMSPEQAAGALERVDRRSDVFGLGSILCEILTGQTAYAGRSVPEVVLKAMRGDTAEALARLDGCGADAELIALAKDCLAVEPDNRPADANVVAKRITAYMAGVQQRLQAAERDRAVAVAKAIEERRRRKVQLALAASILAFASLGGLSTTYYFQQQQARAAAGERVVDQVTTLRGQAIAQPEDIQRWEVALAAAEQADPSGDQNAKARLLTLRAEIKEGLDAARRDKALLDRLVDIRSTEPADHGAAGADGAYGDAFREAGIDLADLSPNEAGARIKARPISVTQAMAGALDDWANVRRRAAAGSAGAARLSAAARIADPDPWRTELRIALDKPGTAARLHALQALAKRANYDELGPISLHLLGTGLEAAGDRTLAATVLRKALERHPRDVWVNFELGRVLDKLSRLKDAIRFYTAARALRPETAHLLAHALERTGEGEEAIAVFRDLVRLRPEDGEHLGCLGHSLHLRGRAAEAGDLLAQADESLRAWIRLHPDDAKARTSLANSLRTRGKLEEAVAEGREVIRLWPTHAHSYSNLGFTLAAQGKADEAIAAYRTAIRLEPDDPSAHRNLGAALAGQGKLSEGAAELREAIRLNPEHAEAHYDLGISLKFQGKLPEAIAAFREAIRLKPDSAPTHYDLGNALKDQGKLDDAIAEYRTAIRLQPDHAEAHCNLGIFLQQQGAYAEALEMLRKGHELGSRRPDWQYPSARWIAEAERALASANRSPAVLRGEDTAKADSFRNRAGSQNPAAAPPVVTAAVRGQHLAAGDPAPKLDVKSFVKGEPIAGLEPGKFYVVEFWATWCGPCRASIPHLTKLQRKHPDVVFIGVSIWEQDQNAVKPFVDMMGDQMAYRVAVDSIPEKQNANDGFMSTQWMKAAGQGGIPAAFIVDKGGKIAWSGHPMSMDEPLEKIVSGSWDLVAESARARKAQQNRATTSHEESAAGFRDLITLRPDDGGLYSNYGRLLGYLGRHDEAIEACRKAIKLNPKDGGAHYNLGNSLAAQGHLHDALAAFGEAQRVEPSLSQSREWQLLYHAACAAASAAAGNGKDEPPPDDAAKVKLRSQALEGLRAEYQAWARLLGASAPQARPLIAQNLKHWKQDSSLAGVRDEEALARLPEGERKEWQALWADVDSLHNRAAMPSATNAIPKGTAPARQDVAPAEPKPSTPPQGAAAPRRAPQTHLALQLSTAGGP